MCKRNNSALFFICSLIEQLGRDLHIPRGQVVAKLGPEDLRALFDHADVLHTEPLEKVADDVITEFSLSRGDYDNVAQARYSVPDVWTMGKVYARLIEDISNEESILQTLIQVYSSWMDEALSDYNSSLYYQPRDYLAECFRQGGVIDG